jgi:hypothetical protein
MAVHPEADERLPESGALTDELDALETALSELRARYEQYFLGVDRHPPTKAYDTTRQRLGRLRALFVRSAGLKFRIQSLQQRFTTYDRLWKRTLSEMENGTYKRDLFKARRRRRTEDAVPATPPEPPAPAVAAPALTTPPGPPPPIPTVTQGGTLRAGPVPTVAPVSLPTGTQGGVVRPPPLPGVPARAPPPPIPQGTQGGVAAAAAAALAEPRLRAVYEAYLTAKKSCQEDVSRLSFESVADSLRKQVPELLERHGARDVEYKVVVKDGKAVLRAVPKG